MKPLKNKFLHFFFWKAEFPASWSFLWSISKVSTTAQNEVFFLVQVLFYSDESDCRELRYGGRPFPCVRSHQFLWLASQWNHTAYFVPVHSPHHIVMLCRLAHLYDVSLVKAERSLHSLSLSLHLLKVEGCCGFSSCTFASEWESFSLAFLCVPLPSVWASSYVCVRFTSPPPTIEFYCFLCSHNIAKRNLGCIVW